MDISFTKDVLDSAKIDPARLIGIYSPRDIEGEGLSDDEIKLNKGLKVIRVVNFTEIYDSKIKKGGDYV